MSNFRELTFEEIFSLLSPKKDTLLLVHRNPDADAIGSAMAMKAILADLGSESYLLCSTEIPERLRFLTDGLQKSILPDSIPAGFHPKRILALDVASPSQLGSLWETFEGKIDLMIDHHGIGTHFANYYVNPKAAATGEILYSLACDRKIQLTAPILKNIYAAVSSDTGCFRYSNTTANAHLIACVTLLTGVDTADINHRLFEAKSMEQLKAESAAIAGMKCYFGGKVAVVTVPYSLKLSLGVSDEHLETLVEVARSLSGVLVAFAVRQPTEEGVFRVSARSSCDFNVATLCQTFGGGGHIRAAGCSVQAKTVEDAVKKLLAQIDEKDLH